MLHFPALTLPRIPQVSLLLRTTTQWGSEIEQSNRTWRAVKWEGLAHMDTTDYVGSK